MYFMYSAFTGENQPKPEDADSDDSGPEGIEKAVVVTNPLSVGFTHEILLHSVPTSPG